MLEDSSHVNNQLYAFYAQEDWDILDELNIVAGVRADYHEKYHWHVTPKVSLLWHFCDHVSFRAGYAQGFRSRFSERTLPGIRYGWYGLVHAVR